MKESARLSNKKVKAAIGGSWGGTYHHKLTDQQLTAQSKIRKRREEAWELLQRGHPMDQIAKRMNVPYHIITADMSVMRMENGKA